MTVCAFQADLFLSITIGSNVPHVGVRQHWDTRKTLCSNFPGTESIASWITSPIAKLSNCESAFVLRHPLGMLHVTTNMDYIGCISLHRLWGTPDFHLPTTPLPPPLPRSPSSSTPLHLCYSVCGPPHLLQTSPLPHKVAHAGTSSTSATTLSDASCHSELSS